MENQRSPIFGADRNEGFRKCGIVGCGSVGSAIAYALMQTGWFTELVLLDTNTKKAAGEAADLRHGLPFHTPMTIRAGGYPDLVDCGVILLTAGALPTEGQSRNELARINARILRTAVNNIAIYNQTAVLLTVTDPVDLLSFVIHRASGYPACRVLGIGTVLATARLKQLVGDHLGVDSRNVHSFVIGEHGEGEFPIWSSANISGVDLPHFCDACARGYRREELNGLFQKAKQDARETLLAKGSACYAIAESVKRILSAIIHDENTVLPVSALLTGEYGLRDVYMSLPCLVNRRGVSRVLEIPLDQEETQRLHQSAASLQRALGELEEIGFGV